MKALKTASITAMVAGSMTLLAAPAFGIERGPSARSLRQVDAIWLDSNICMGEISDQLDRHGFVLTGSPRSSDAVLTVDVDPHSRERASYVATLRGDDGRVLFRTAGREESMDDEEVCEDIGEEIADRIESRQG